jgi:hypothetical protein
LRQWEHRRARLDHWRIFLVTDAKDARLVGKEGTLGNDQPGPDAIPQSSEGAAESAPIAEAVVVADGVPSGADADMTALLQSLGEGLGLGAELPDTLGSLDGELIGALHGLDIADNIGHALDQLTSSPDLFDIPALDFGDHAGHGDA